MTWEFGRDLTKPGEDVYIRVFTLGPGQVPPKPAPRPHFQISVAQKVPPCSSAPSPGTEVFAIWLVSEEGRTRLRIDRRAPL
jgi:hypothetical protein